MFSELKSVYNNKIKLDGFEGVVYKLANNWLSTIKVFEYISRPIQYLEIGTFYGANLISVSQTYGSHPESKLYCVDPWTDYSEYPEYKDQQSTIYTSFQKNIKTAGIEDKVVVKRGFSHIIVPTFPDEYFDIIYIDGNHEPEYVMEDAVLCFRKLKKNGIMIFDDYGWGGPDLTTRGIDGFLSGYHKRIKHLGMETYQVFVQKL
jgi:predicted O-methyltransferase YrrM